MKKVNIEEILKLRNDGLSYNEISKLTNYSKSTISKYCKGIKKINDINPSKIIEAQKIYDKGISLRELEKIIGLSRQTLSKYLIIKDRKIKTNEEIKNLKSNRTKKWKKEFREDLVNQKGGKCIICGYNKSIRALHFHHLNPDEKDFRISIGSVSKDIVLKEVEKCILVCSNCHCEIHDELFENGKSKIIEKLNLI